jgi:glucokinase
MPELDAPKYEVALSYASEDRPYVQRVADRLAAQRINFFYDQFFQTLMWGRELPETFNDIFGGETRYAVVFISEHYISKPWPMYEGRSALSKAVVEHGTYILPVKLDASELPGLHRAVGYVDGRLINPEQLADMIVEKLATLSAAKPRGASPRAMEAPVETPDEIRSKERDEALLKAVSQGADLYVVMDLGGTKAYVSLMTADATSLYDKRFPTQIHNDEDRLLEFIRTCIRAPIDRIHSLTGMKLKEAEQAIKTIGIAFPGPTDFAKGEVLDASNFKIENFPLADKITNAFDIKTMIDNDVNLGALGEAWKGAAKGYSNIIGIMIGTGIGGGIIANGQIYRGRNKTAGEIGHMVLSLDSDIQCGCGQYGCFEALASRKSMARDISKRKRERGNNDRLWGQNNLLSNQIAAYYLQGDRDVIAVVNRAAEICGKGVFTLLNLFNPEIIVFNGGFVQQLGQVFLDPVREEANKCMNAVYSLGDKKIPIVLGELRNPVLFGACKMAIEGSAGRAQRAREEILSGICADLSEDDLNLLKEIRNHGEPVPTTDHSGSDLTKDRLRLLRNRGLISTEPGQSFKHSNSVTITDLGRIVVEEVLEP